MLSATTILAYALLAASAIVQGFELGARWALILLVSALVAWRYAYLHERDSQ